MGEVISLNQARKARDKKSRERQAAANRLRFGRDKGERQRTADEQSKTKRDLDAKALPPRSQPEDKEEGEPK